MANKKINQLDSRAGASLSDLSLVGDPINGVSYKLTLTQISTLMGVPGKFNQPTGTTAQYLRGDGSLATFPVVGNGTVTSVDMSVPTGLTISGNPITTSGTLAVALASGYSIPTTASQATWDAAYNDKINSAAVTGTTTKTLTLNQQDGGSVTASWSDLNTDAVTSVFGRTGAVVATEGDYTLTQLGDVTLTSPTNGQVLKYNGTTWVNNTDTDTGLTSVGLSMPSAFSVSNSPLTSNGTLAVTGAGTSAQYVRGDGQLANFPTNGGGGSSVNYYLNGSVSQGTFGGDTYYEMSQTPIIGAGTNFTRTSAQGNGYIASFITDAGDPALLNIPGGNWNIEFYFNASSGGGTPSFYNELYKVSSSNVFTLIANGSTNPEGITQGTVVDQYFTSIPVPQTSLLATDRIAVRIFVTPDGRNITLHTENSNLCEVLTTFSTGLNALNGLTTQVQYFATGTSGTDFNISSVTDTHTFNLPDASATARGLITTGIQTIAGAKTFSSAVTSTNFILSGGTGNTGLYYGHTNKVVLANYVVGGGIDFETNGGAINMVLDASANLSVVGSVTAASLIKSGGTSSQYLMADGSTSTLTNPVTGTGTTNYLPKWTSGSAIGNSNLINDASGNLGLGVTPSAWVSGAKVIDIGAYSSFFQDSDGYPQMTFNAYESASNVYRYKQNDLSTRYRQWNGNHQWYNAPSGTAGNAITFTQAMTLTANGRLLLGTITEGSELLQLSGTMKVTGASTFGDSVTTNKTIFANVGFNSTILTSSDATNIANGFNLLGSSSYWGIRTSTDYSFNIDVFNSNSPITALKILNTGAATFSSSVTATAAVFNLNTTDGGFKVVGVNASPTTLAYLANNYFTKIYTRNHNFGITFFDQENNNVGIQAGDLVNGSSAKAIIINPYGGNLLVGTTTDSGEKFQVSGSVLATSFIKSGGTSSQYLMADGSVTTGGGLISTNRQTASYTLALTDADKLVEMNVATANNLTVPLNSSIAFPIGTKIDLAQYGAGQTTVVATSGVTVRSAGGALKLALQYSGASLVKIATNEWYLFGDITV